MKLVMTLLVRDEEDILRDNIDFHLSRGVDEIVLMDNLSKDGTPDIAQEYVRAGVLHYTLQTEDDYSQGRWVTCMARYAAEALGADWVINNDADEFWWPASGSLKDAFLALDVRAAAASVERFNFLPRPERMGPFWQSMDVRYRITLNAKGEPLSGKVAHKAYADVEVTQGNHSAHRRGQMLIAAPAPISILHFPIRSLAQFTGKITNGGAAYARNIELDRNIGDHWREFYARHLESGLAEEFAKFVLNEEAIRKGILDDELVFDPRLKDAMDALMIAKTQPGR